MFKPVAMLRVNVLVLEKYLDEVTRAIGELGAVHLADAAPQSREQLLERVDLGDRIRELDDLYRRCGILCESLGVDVRQGEQEGDTCGSPKRIRATLDTIEDAYNQEDDAINRLLVESGTLAEKATRLEAFPFRRIRFAALRDLSYLYIVTGRASPAMLPELQQVLGDRALVLQQPQPGRTESRVLVVSSRRNRWAIESELTKHEVKQEPLPEELDGSADQEAGRVRGKLAEVKTALEQHRRRVLELREKWQGDLCRIWTQLHENLLILRAQEHFGRAPGMYCISGWIPAEERERVERNVQEITGGAAVVEFVDPDRDEQVRNGRERVPVMYRPVRFLRPFQALVSTFGAPRYDEVEPSLYVALSFVVMFGLMFGDLGQGAVIALGGLYLLRTRRPSLSKYSDAGYWLLFCGGSAMIFGLLYGSVFGYEEVPFLPALWLRPLHDTMRLFAVTVAVGVACISIGILINIVNRLRKRQILEGVFDKFGVIGIIFYWGSIGLGIKALYAGRLSAGEVLLLVGLPLAILFLREPLYGLLARRKRLLHEDIFSFVLSSSIEVMETVTTFLGSTVSFARLGGFALSHAALCMAIYAVVDLIRTAPLGTLWAGLVIVLGNVFVILLEGLVVTIQGVRLEYYELFSKYFAGDGVLYRPFRLGEEGVTRKSK